MRLYKLDMLLLLYCIRRLYTEVLLLTVRTFAGYSHCTFIATTYPLYKDNLQS